MDINTLRSPQGNGFGFVEPRYATAYSKPIKRVKNEQSKNRAMAEINASGLPMKLNRDFFATVLTPLGFSLPPTLGLHDSFIKFDSEEEKSVDGSDISSAEYSIDSFEKSIKQAHVHYDQLPMVETDLTPYRMDQPRREVIDVPSSVNLELIEECNHADSYAKAKAPFIPSLFSDFVTKQDRDLEKYRQDFRTFKPKVKDDSIYLRESSHEPPVPGSFRLQQVLTAINSGVFKNAKQAYLNELRARYSSPPSVANYSQFSADQYKYVTKVMNFDDSRSTILFEHVARLRFVYCPSGGGKTTMIRKSRFKKTYVDIDDVIKEHYDRFKLFETLLDQTKDYRYMNQFFKFIFYYNYVKYIDKVVLLNHPNQLPNCFRQDFNELVLIPSQFNWNLRYFNGNLLSLLSVYGKTVILGDYSSYEKIVIQFFRLGLPS